MGSSSDIEWTDSTTYFVRTEGRVRTYTRKRSDRPGTKARREARVMGLRWCHPCGSWKPIVEIDKNGMCREHARAAKRERKRGQHAVPADARARLFEQFGGECAYCDREATTMDHVVAVSRGGPTAPGFIVPACASCNSAKKARSLDDFLKSRARAKTALIVDVLVLAEGEA